MWFIRSAKVSAHLVALLGRNGLEERVQNRVQFVSCAW
jgi:hypothetical protein